MKRAEARIYRDVLTPYWKAGEWAEPLLQVHDALLFECAEQDVKRHWRDIATIMTDPPDWFTLPLAVDAEYGYNRADMVKL